MPKFPFQYSREQRHLIVVEATNYDEAYEKAMVITENLKLSSEDDESDDPGELTDAELTAEEIVKINLGYESGYCGMGVQERVEKLFHTQHPIFGKIKEDEKDAIS